MRIALTRQVSDSIGRCELTHLARTPIDVSRALAQHRLYEEALSDLGCEVRRLQELPDLPDAVFVEDAAIVLDEVAIITRPGASSRRAETSSVAKALSPLRPLRSIDAPGTLDGGDVLRLGRRIWVGITRRTSAEGIENLRRHVAPFGYEVTGVAVRGCLHLKSAATAIGSEALLVNPAWVDPAVFDGLEIVEIDPSEPFAANALLVGEAVIYPEAYPSTERRLRARRIDLRTVDASELAKAEGGVTCCSLIVEI